MRSTFLFMLAALVALPACQKKSEEAPAARSINPTEEMRTMGSHDPQGCPQLEGIYVPTQGQGSYFQFTKFDGALVMKSRRPDGPEFQGAIRIDGTTKYTNGEAATARCYGGKILADISHPTKPKVTVLFKGGPQGMTRVIFQDGKEPHSTEYARLIE